MNKQASIFKRISPELVIRYNGHVSLEREGVASQDQGRLFEALSRNPAKLTLKLSSSRSKPRTILTLIHIQEALESEATIVTKRIYIRIEALAQFLCLYYYNKNTKDFNPPEYLRAIQKDLFQIYQLPKLKPICKRLESLAQRMEAGAVVEEYVTEEIIGVMRDLVHSVSR